MIEVKERPKARSDSTAFPIRKIGVIGAGQMGSGIAHVTALAGFEVKISDLSADRIKAGIATINGNMARQVSRKRITEEERQAALKRITPAENLDAFGDCDIVIEAIVERRTDPRSSRVVLIEGGDRILSTYPRDLSAQARQALERLGVEIRTGTRATRTASARTPTRGGSRADSR